MLVRRAAVLAILLSTFGFLQWPAWSTPPEPCEPLLVSANIEGLVRLAVQSGLGTVEIQAWSLRSVPGPIEFRQTLNSSQLAVVQGFRKVAASKNFGPPNSAISRVHTYSRFKQGHDGLLSG